MISQNKRSNSKFNSIEISFYSAGNLIGSRILESVADCNKILLPPYYYNSLKIQVYVN